MAVGYGRRVRKLMIDFVNGKAPTAPAAWYFSLHTTNPGDDGQGGGEPVAGTGGYARKQITGAAAGWTAGSTPANDSPVVADNVNSESFTTSTAAFSTGSTPLAYLGVWDHATNTLEANYIGRVLLTNSQIVNAAGITINIPAGNLDLTGTST